MPMFFVKFMVSLSLGVAVDHPSREGFVTTNFTIYSRAKRDGTTSD